MKQEPLFDLPPWMPVEPWREFLKMRAKKRNAPTEYAKALLIARLDRLRLDGHDVRTIIDNSIEHGWLTFYEPKENGNGKGKSDVFAISRQALSELESGAVPSSRHDTGIQNDLRPRWRGPIH